MVRAIGAIANELTKKGKEQDLRLVYDEEEAQGAIPSLQPHVTLYKNLHNFRQVGSVEGYIEAFYQLI